MSDAWSYWRAALMLAGDCGKLTREQVEHIGPVHEDEPRCGYWRKPLGRKGENGFLPVVIWRDEITDEPLALEDGLYADPFEVWSWCLRFPVTEETYQAVIEGHAWPVREDVR